MDTKYASPDRTPREIIIKLFHTLNEVPLIQDLLNKSSEILFVLDKNRQVVFTNKAFMDFVGVTEIMDILGKRPGEALNCVHSDDVSGCGTTEFCVQCGAVNAILRSQDFDEEAKEECMLSIQGGVSFELQVVAKPFEFMGNRFTFFTAKDISESKRKSALERIFFHDILNLASGIYSIIELVKEEEKGSLPEDMLSLLYRSSSEMVTEINDFRTLLLAERNELKVRPINMKTDSLAENIFSLYKTPAEKGGVRFVVGESCESAEFRSDKSLLSRVLVNMVKNAIEASSDGDTVTLNCGRDEKGVFFSVHNPAVMPENVSTQIFKRTFSTKHSGSGLGTYSMKLLGENYLRGDVSFCSEENKGTLFTISLPEKI